MCPWKRGKSNLLGRPVTGERNRKLAAQRYAAVVALAAEGDGTEEAFWQTGLCRQIFLGDEAFVARMQALALPAQRTAVDVPKAQRKSPCTLKDCLKRFPDRADALRMAYRQCGFTMTALAKDLGLSVSRVSRLISAADRVAQGKSNS